MTRRTYLRLFAAVAALLATAALTGALTATAAPLAVPSPLNSGPDPSLLYHRGDYYLATTQGDRISVWKSITLDGLPKAPETVVWRDSVQNRNKQVWAPALHRFQRPEGARWYIYYTASDGNDAQHRMYVIESAGDNPLGPYHFKARLADFGEYAIDGEPFVHNGRMYFAWSGPGRGMSGPAQIYLSAMSDPWTTIGNRVALPASGGCVEVREGAAFVSRNGRTFMVYSTCDTGKPDYQLWMKSLLDGADPMNAANWAQHSGPVFTRDDAAGVFGPGHNSFFRSPDGTEDWIAYHAKTASGYTYDGRTTRAQRIGWNPDGTPALGRPLPLGAAQALPSGDQGPVFHQIRNSDATWTGFAPVAGVGTSEPAAGSDVAIAGMPDGSAQVLIIGNDRGVYHQTRKADGTWTGFTPLAGQGTPQSAKGGRVAVAATPAGAAHLLIVGQ
ncbi:glycoside hydrolase family 43 protein [Micromonospora sp. STR1s_5]|nr:glycoside hydrolase family 43 protein [Micromonospora sp. STR1s_5]